MDQTVEPAGVRLAHAQIRTILVGVMLAMLLGALDQTIVATALPTIGRELGGVQGLSWVITAYLLSATAVTPLYGKLSDVHGRRAMLLIAIAVFLAGSVVCALAKNIYVLIAARALQGIGGGGLISLGQTIVGDVIAPRERGKYQAYFASVFVTASIAGPILGGIFAEHLHWSFIFWINLPLGALAYLMTNRVLKLLPRHDRPHRVDILGAMLMVVATVALLLALTWGGSAFAWDSLLIVLLFIVSAVGWVAFALRLMRAAEPFIPLSILGHQVVRNGIIATAFAVGSLTGLTVFVPLYFEAVLGLTAGQSGLALISFVGGTVAGATLAGRIMVHYVHYKRSAVVGLAVGAVATAALAVWPAGLSLTTIEIILAIAGIACGTIYPITTVSLQNAVPLNQLGTVTGVLNFFRSLGGALVVAAFGAIFLATAAASPTMSVQTIIDEGARAGVDFGPVFRGVFIAAALANAIALVFIIAMKELPLRGHQTPAEVVPH